MTNTTYQYLNGVEAAEIAGIRFTYLASLARKGEGPPYRMIAGRKVYLRDEVIAWDKERTARLSGLGRKRNKEE